MKHSVAMKLSSEDLTRHLAQGLHRCIFVHGEALLLAIEAADAIRAAARAAEYVEREVMIVEQGFKWAELRNSAQSLSLFSTRNWWICASRPASPAWKGRRPCRIIASN